MQGGTPDRDDGPGRLGVRVPFAAMSGDLHGRLVVGPVGDVLGAPVEFMSLREIRATFGAEGITEFAPAYGREAGANTDDTQMTLFVFEGLIRAQLRRMDRGICNPA